MHTDERSLRKLVETPRVPFLAFSGLKPNKEDRQNGETSTQGFSEGSFMGPEDGPLLPFKGSDVWALHVHRVYKGVYI